MGTRGRAQRRFVGGVVSFSFGLVLSSFWTAVFAQTNTTVPESDPKICEGGSGTFLPAFNGQGEDDWPKGLKIFLYFIGLMYSFAGVGVVTDAFMESIEYITSKEKLVMVDNQQVRVAVWNPTVANLTLMALGSSAPEIFLSLIEIVSDDFFSGALGPSTIVGSAAFNLLVILAVCVTAIPAGETRKIANLGVFAVTSSMSIFAYLWLLIILLGSTPDAIELWEGLVTLFFFPLLVFVAYLADKGYFTRKEDMKAAEERLSTADSVLHMYVGDDEYDFTPWQTMELLGGQVHRNIDPKSAANLATANALKAKPLSRAWYRINANRKLVGGKPVLPDFEDKEIRTLEMTEFSGDKKPLKERPQIRFEVPKYSVIENVPEIVLKVIRLGKKDVPVTVDFKTEGVTATEDEDYVGAQGTLRFDRHECEQTITIKIIDDDEPEDDETFLVKLFDPDPDTAIITQGVAEVTIIDDDHPGAIGLEHAKYEVLECDGKVDIVVLRTNGSKGEISVDYHTVDGSATAPHDYTETKGTLVFGDREISKVISIPIIDDEDYEKDEKFRFIIDNPQNGASLGSITVAEVIILNDDEITNIVDKVTALLKINLDRFKVGRSNWASQFEDALEWPDDDVGFFGKALHAVNIPWKVLGAIVPPPVFLGGWLAFIIALVLIGFITAIIGDLASLFGCSLGLKDSVTAITFVALGTSLPDTFASRTAALQDSTADASIGNVTGSNSVNVFLGLGLSWAVGSIYWTITGATKEWKARVGPSIVADYPDGVFHVDSGDLAFSVIVFSVCAVLCLGTLLLRRKYLGSEFGGGYERETAALFVFLWFLYVLLSSLKAYKHF
eukprot:m.138988 g.138988  ORF g.138988 m.138988 type:complete len:841 (+) comp24055_c1_seq3:37-2559(+)